MSNLRDAKPRVKTITLNDGVEREICFTLNAMAELEERYGSVDAALAALNTGSVKAVRCLLWAGMIDTDENLTEQQVGKLIDIDCLSRIMDDLNAAMEEDMPIEATSTAAKPVPGSVVTATNGSAIPNV